MTEHGEAPIETAQPEAAADEGIRQDGKSEQVKDFRVRANATWSALIANTELAREYNTHRIETLDFEHDWQIGDASGDVLLVPRGELDYLMSDVFPDMGITLSLEEIGQPATINDPELVERKVSRVETLSARLKDAGIGNQIWDRDNHLRVYITPLDEWLKPTLPQDLVSINIWFEYGSPEKVGEARKPYDGNRDLTSEAQLQILVQTNRGDKYDRELRQRIDRNIGRTLIEHGIRQPGPEEEKGVMKNKAPNPTSQQSNPDNPERPEIKM